MQSPPVAISSVIHPAPSVHNSNVRGRTFSYKGDGQSSTSKPAEHQFPPERIADEQFAVKLQTAERTEMQTARSTGHIDCLLTKRSGKPEHICQETVQNK
jgi:hypothetical protein